MHTIKSPILTEALKGLKKYKAGTICALLAGMLLSSCSLINEDLPPCAPDPKSYTVVDFVYDYNMYETDLFDEHVGSVYLYVFDENGIFHYREEKHKHYLTPNEDMTMTISDDILVPGNTYSFVAVAQGNGFGIDQTDENYKWFELVNPMKEGESTIKDYILRLYRDPDNDGFGEVGVINYKDQYGETKQMIDTLWTTKPHEVQTFPINKLENYTPTSWQQPDNVTNVTVPLMRITNAVKVNVTGPLITANTDKDDYHVVIYFPEGNGTVDFTGDISQSSQPLYYRSLVKEVAPLTTNKEIRTRSSEVTRDDNDANTKYALQARFGVSRLIKGDGSKLQLYKADDLTKPIAEIDFTDYLTKYLNESGYDDQEWLNREYDFEVDMALDNNYDIVYLQFTCSILSWARRVSYYDL